MEGEKVNKLNE